MRSGLQDTTELNCATREATEGLGYLNHPAHRGLIVHSTLAVNTEGVPQGLLHQQVWTRDPAERGKASRRKQRPIEKKESSKWLVSTDVVEAALPGSRNLVVLTPSRFQAAGFASDAARGGSLDRATGRLLARKSDGEPGVKTVWIGWGRLRHSVETRQILCH